MNKLKRSLLKLLALAGLIFLLTACPKPPIVEREPIIPDTTKVPDEATRNALTVFNVDTGEMRFNASTPILDNLKPGDAFVSEPSTAAPYGFLRKVESVTKDGGEVVVTTSEAKLTDAIHQGTLNARGEIQPSQLRSVTPLSEGASGRALTQSEISAQAGTSKGFNFEAGIDAFVEVTASSTDIDAEAKAKVKFQGLVKFNVGYRVLVDIGFLADLNWAEAALGFNEEVTILVDGEVSGEIKEEKEVARFDFDAITFFIGPVPVVIVPSAKVTIGVKGEAEIKFDYKFSQVAAFEQGVRWDEDDGWSKIDRNEFKVTHEGPNFQAQGSLSAYSRANMRLLFYNVAGPDLGLTIGGKLEVTYPGDPLWRLFGFVQGDLGLTVDILGEELSYNEQLFKVEKEIARGEAKPPEITILNSNPSVDLLFDTDLAQFFTIKDQIGFSYELRSDKGEVFNGSFLDGKLFTKVKFTTEGVRTMTITARSSTGKSAQGFFTINVINTPPEAPSLFDETNLSVGQGDEFDLNLNTPTDKNSGTLDCATAVRWVVSGTDSLVTENGSSLGCSATATFGTQGTRTVKAIITDPQGLSTERTFDITVGPEPAIKSPKISEIVVNNGDVKRNGLVYYTIPLTASIIVTNPDNVSFSSTWSVLNDNPRSDLFLDRGVTSVTVQAGQIIDDGQQGPIAICGGGSEATPAKAKFIVEIEVLGRTRTKVFDFNCAPVPPK
jgi:hypothetical protein